LRVVEPPGLRGRAYPLDDEVTLGRAAGCQVPLDDAYASQVHARVFQREGQWYIEDLGSTNGTYLNRRRVAGPMVMKRRDRVQIGNIVLELV
jgi:pSer/pThr/pTyr-binding forkhead associated (FHA) protein